MDDTGRRAGLYVITRGTRVGWSVSGVSLLVSASERVMSLTRPISWLRKERLYPRLLRYVLSSLVRSVSRSRSSVCSDISGCLRENLSNLLVHSRSHLFI